MDGNAHRTKIRIRWYGNIFGLIRKPVLELKIKNSLLGRKESFRLSTLKLDKGFNRDRFSNMFQTSNLPELLVDRLKLQSPVLLNSYTRKYYQSIDRRYRITIDTDQLFYKIGVLNNTFIYKVTDKSNIILELKYDYIHDDAAETVTNQFPFRLTKSSKYVTGIEKLYSV